WNGALWRRQIWQTFPTINGAGRWTLPPPPPRSTAPEPAPTRRGEAKSRNGTGRHACLWRPVLRSSSDVLPAFGVDSYWPHFFVARQATSALCRVTVSL